MVVLLGHWGSDQQELAPAHMARLNLSAQTLFKCLKPALPLFASPWQGVDFYKSHGDGAFAVQILLEELRKYTGLAMYAVKDI